MNKRISYKKLAVLHHKLVEWEKAEIEKNGNNEKRLGYHCYQCGTIISTLKNVPGTTAMRIDCVKKDCKGIMLHSDSVYGYNKDIEDTYEWIRPSLKWIQKHRDKVQLLDHVFKGGLIIKRIK